MLLLLLFLISAVIAKCDMKSCQKNTPTYCSPYLLITNNECVCNEQINTKVTNYDGSFVCVSGPVTCNSTNLKYCCDEGTVIDVKFAKYSIGPINPAIVNSATNSCIPVVAPTPIDMQANCSDISVINSTFYGYNGTVCVSIFGSGGNVSQVYLSYIENYTLGACAAQNAGYTVVYYGSCCPDGQVQKSTYINPDITDSVVVNLTTLNSTCQCFLQTDIVLNHNYMNSNPCKPNQYPFDNCNTWTCRNLCTEGSTLVLDNSFRGYHCNCSSDVSCKCKNGKCKESCYTDGYNYVNQATPPCDCNFTKLFDGYCPTSCQSCLVTELGESLPCPVNLCYGIENHFCNGLPIAISATCSGLETWGYLGSDGQVYMFDTRQYNFYPCVHQQYLHNMEGHECKKCNNVHPPVNVTCVNEVLNGECVASLYETCGSCVAPYDPNSIRLCCPNPDGSSSFESSGNTYQDSTGACCHLTSVDNTGMCCFTANGVDNFGTCCPDDGYSISNGLCVLSD